MVARLIKFIQRILPISRGRNVVLKMDFRSSLKRDHPDIKIQYSEPRKHPKVYDLRVTRKNLQPRSNFHFITIKWADEDNKDFREGDQLILLANNGSPLMYTILAIGFLKPYWIAETKKKHIVAHCEFCGGDYSTNCEWEENGSKCFVSLCEECHNLEGKVVCPNHKHETLEFIETHKDYI